ncbi:hypothetical protein F8388_007573, partial [Cannabis sativa]
TQKPPNPKTDSSTTLPISSGSELRSGKEKSVIKNLQLFANIKVWFVLVMADCNSKSKIGSSSNVSAGLSYEIIEEIISRLDAKSVIRLKCLSKHWFSRISEPSFMDAHHKNQVHRTLLGFSLECSNDDTHSVGGIVMRGSIRSSENFDEILFIEFPVCRRNVEFVGSDNGVICLVEEDHNEVYLWNPAIEMGKHKKLPPSPYAPSRGRKYSIHTLYGFGYEGLTMISKWWLHHMEINNVVHSFKEVSKLPRRYEGVDYYYGVVAFDLSSEEFKLIKLPSSFKYKDSPFPQIFNMRDCLSLLTFNYSTKIEIWVMKEYGVWDSWTKHLSLGSSQINLFQIWPLGVSHNGNLLLSKRIVDEPSLDESSPSTDFRTLSFYDPKSRRVQYIGRQERGSNFATYAESIFLS